MFHGWNVDVEDWTYSSSLVLHLSEEHASYLNRCARIRDITVRSLLADILVAVAKDQLVAAVLDDEGRTRPKRKHHRYNGKEYPL